MSYGKCRIKPSAFALISWNLFVSFVRMFLSFHRAENNADFDKDANRTTKNGKALHSHVELFLLI